MPASTGKLLVGLPEYHHLHGSDGDRPLYLMLNLPTTCKFRCLKCALSCTQIKHGPLLTSEEQSAIIRAGAAAGLRTLVIIGNGEPTENVETIRGVIDVAHEQKMGTIMFSTLNDLDRQQANYFAAHDVSVIVSLDSLDQKMYRRLTGTGDLVRTLEHAQLLRSVYAAHDSNQKTLGGKKLVRLGVNTTVSTQNVAELSTIRSFCGDDVAYYANPPMRRGRLTGETQWTRLVPIGSKGSTRVDTEYETLKAEAERFSDTGGHSSIIGGVCGYFALGVSIDVDGEVLTCGYAGETAGRIGNACGATPEQLLGWNKLVRDGFARFSKEIGRLPSCPIRDPAFPKFVNEFNKK